MLYTILLFQAGGFALQYLSDGNKLVIDPTTEEVVVVKMPLNLPYQPDWVAPVEMERSVIEGDEFYSSYERKAVNGTEIAEEQNSREIFQNLANQLNKQLNDEPNSGPDKAKLINILVKEYCAQSSGWVIYIMDWSTSNAAPIHPILATKDFSSDFFSPPRQA